MGIVKNGRQYFNQKIIFLYDSFFAVFMFGMLRSYVKCQCQCFFVSVRDLERRKGIKLGNFMVQVSAPFPREYKVDKGW